MKTPCPDNLDLASPEALPGKCGENRPAYNSRILKVYLEYLEQQHPGISIPRILKESGITLFEVEDPGHWFNQQAVDRFYQTVERDTGDSQLARRVGRYLAMSETIALPRQFTLGLLNLKTIYTLMGPLQALISRSAEVRTRTLGPNRIEIVNTVRPGFEERPYQCENRLGIYESMGKLFGSDFAEVSHPECLHRGGACCRYLVSWQSPRWMAWQRRRNWWFLSALPAALALIPLANRAELALGWLAVSALITLLAEHYKAGEYAVTIRTQAGKANDHIKAADLRYNNALMVQEIGQAAATLHDEADLVEAAARIMQERSVYDRGLIMLANPDTTRLHFAAGFGYDEETRRKLQQTAFNLDRPDAKGVFVKAFREKKPFLVQDIEQILYSFSARSQDLARELAIKSIICVPIAYEEQVLGIIAIDNSRNDRSLTQSDVSLLMGIAWQLAVGIINIRAFRQIKASEKKYRDVVESASSIILRIDVDGRIRFSNRFAQTLLGIRQSALAGRPIQEVLPSEGDGAWSWSGMVNRIVASGRSIAQVEEKVFRLADGRLVWVAWTFQPIFTDGGGIKEVLCIGNDISQLMQTRQEKAELEMQLLRAQKMEALGTLAGGVAHDLNNVLAGLINYPELMLMQMPADSPWRRYVEGIKKSGEKAAAIVQDLLTLARRNVVQKEVLNLNGIVNDYLDSTGYERLLQDHPRARIQAHLQDDLANIQGAPVSLSKALMNLVTNAVEALEGRPGEVSIATANRHLDKDLAGYETVPRGDHVVLSVRDTGCGIAEADLHRIFEPFFTKKQMGRSGTGLGMAVVWGAIKDHGGRIDIHSALGQGTCFEIYFAPTARQAAAVVETPTAALAGRGEKILVVDDAAIQCEIAQEILAGLGYQVAAVSSGGAAVDYVQANPVDLLVIDMIMPEGIDGLETYRRIACGRPGQRAIITSGHSDNEKVRQAMVLGVGAYVKKPYTLEELGQAVRRELDRNG